MHPAIGLEAFVCFRIFPRHGAVLTDFTSSNCFASLGKTAEVFARFVHTLICEINVSYGSINRHVTPIGSFSVKMYSSAM